FVGALGVVAGLATLLSVAMRRRWRSREAFFLVATLLAIGVVYFWPGVIDAFHLLFRYAANARVRLFIAFFLAVRIAPMTDMVLRGERTPVLTAILLTSALYLLMLRFDFPSRAARWDAVLALLPSVIVLFLATIAALAARARWLAL